MHFIIHTQTRPFESYCFLPPPKEEISSFRNFVCLYNVVYAFSKALGKVILLTSDVLHVPTLTRNSMTHKHYYCLQVFNIRSVNCNAIVNSRLRLIP